MLFEPYVFCFHIFQFSFFFHLDSWSWNYVLIAPFPGHCLRVPYHSISWPTTIARHRHFTMGTRNSLKNVVKTFFNKKNAARGFPISCRMSNLGICCFIVAGKQAKMGF